MKYNFESARRTGATGVLVAVLSLGSGAVLAQSPLYQNEHMNESVQASTVSDYIDSKYQKQFSEIHLMKGEHGVHGSMLITGDLTPAGLRTPADADKSQRASMLVRSFLAQESAMLLDVAKLSELSIRKIHVEPTGRVLVFLDRYVGGLKIEDSSMHFSISPEGRLESVSAHLVAMSAALREAVRQTSLDEKQIRTLIGQDFKRPVDVEYRVESPSIVNMTKVARASAPYVVWRVNTTLWDYTVDAFNGEILYRMPQLIIN